MLQNRFAAKLAVITAILSLGMSSVAIATAGVSAPSDPISGPCGPYPTTCPPEKPIPIPDPCSDNPDPIYYEQNCVDPAVPNPGPSDPKPSSENPSDFTASVDYCDSDLPEICDGSTRPRPVMRFAARPR